MSLFILPIFDFQLSSNLINHQARFNVSFLFTVADLSEFLFYFFKLLFSKKDLNFFGLKEKSIPLASFFQSFIILSHIYMSVDDVLSFNII